LKHITKQTGNKALFRKIKNSDFDAFRELYDSEFSSLYAYACRFVNQKDIAKDITQETFLSLWEHRVKIRSIKNVKGYLHKNIKNRCLNYFKHLKIEENHRDKAYIELKEIELNSPDKYNNIFAYIDQEELKTRVNKILDKLPDERRKVFELSRFEGLKNHEIAKKLELSVRTVDTQIYRALKTFKEQLKDLV
jgi:RNA polymerase sigma-70 factor (family 1)